MDFDREFVRIQKKASLMFWVTLTFNLLLGAGILTLLGLGIKWLWNHV